MYTDKKQFSKSRITSQYNFDKRDDQENSDDYRDPDTKTFNEDEESYNKKNGQEDKKTRNNGTEGNDWDSNNPVERSNDARYNDEDRDDYISGDHTNYNLSNSRFGWYDFD